MRDLSNRLFDADLWSMWSICALCSEERRRCALWAFALEWDGRTANYLLVAKSWGESGVTVNDEAALQRRALLCHPKSIQGTVA